MEVFRINLSFLFDPLSLFFLSITAFLGLSSCIYGIGYLHGMPRGRKFLHWVLFAVFVLSIAAVFSAANLIFFLVAWELMSLTSYLLIVLQKQERATMAGMVYVVMTHAGTAFLILAFMILWRYSGSFEISTLKDVIPLIPANTRNLLFALFFAGFATKAGLVPLHLWLPYAHPEAPSHISALMSGIMIKTAVYGMLRFPISLLSPYMDWPALVVIFFAFISCLVGIMYALMEKDIKKILAYSSVENMGIIFMALGAALLLSSHGLPLMASLALSAGLFHLFNHALFKALLFLSAGSVYHATGTRNLEKLGGLIKFMPYTALFFLVGSLSVCAIPPLNGFYSEWFILQSFFAGASGGGTTLTKAVLYLCSAGLVLTGGLACAAFVKAFGVAFLGLPRSQKAVEVKECGTFMTIAMGLLLSGVLLVSVIPAKVLSIITAVSSTVLPAHPSGESGYFALNGYNSAAIDSRFFWIFALIAFAAAGLWLLAAKAKREKRQTWDCGYYKLSSENEYSATAFSKPFRIAFSFFLKPYSKTEKIRDSFYHVRYFRYELYTTPVFKRYFYNPALRSLLFTARTMKRIQPGSIHLYISYIMATILMLLLFNIKGGG